MSNSESSETAATKVRGYCTLCTAQCATIATMESGRVTELEADPDHPHGGALCIKGKAARGRGMKLVAVDPRRIGIPDHADVLLQLRPGF